MNLFKESWVTTQKVEGKDRERIFILLEAAGFKIWYALRNYDENVIAKHLGWYGEGKSRTISTNHVFGTDYEPGDMYFYKAKEGVKWLENYHIKHKLTIKQLEKELIKIIKNEPV